jgi:xylan 1,4-beta-xylosidase
MSYWTFSDVFEEQGVVKQPFYGGYGLVAAGGIPKPAYRAFRLLHQLGGERLALDSDSALLTRRSDGGLVVAVWNLVPAEQTGTEKVVTIRANPPRRFRQATISRLDRDHGDPHPLYEKMGSPRYPTETQLRELRKVADSPVPEVRELQNGELILRLPPEGLAVIELH